MNDFENSFVLGSARGQATAALPPTTTGSSSLIAQLSARLTPTKQQQLHNERFNEARIYAQQLQHGGSPAGGGGVGVYEAAAAALGRPLGGAESIYGKKTEYYAPRQVSHALGTGSGSSSASAPFSSAHLPAPPHPPVLGNNNQRLQQQQQRTAEQQNEMQQAMEKRNQIYYAPHQLCTQNMPVPPGGGGGRYQTPPQPIPSSASSHYSINQKIYMSPTNPFLATSPPPNTNTQCIYGERPSQPPPPSPRHAPPAVPQRSYLAQYHAQSQMDHSSSQGQQIPPPSQYLYQRPQPPGTKFVNSPIYNAGGGGGDRGGQVIYHGATSPPTPQSSSLSSSNMISTAHHPSKYPFVWRSV